jgi:hypothetical protein
MNFGYENSTETFSIQGIYLRNTIRVPTKGVGHGAVYNTLHYIKQHQSSQHARFD